MPLRSVWIALLGVALLATTLSAAPPTNWRKDYNAALAEAQRLNRPLLIHFYAADCGPCVTMERTILHHADVEQRLAEKLVGVSINVSEQERVRQMFGVQSWPTDIIIDPTRPAQIATSKGARSVVDYCHTIDTAVTWYQRIHPVAASPVAKPTPEAGPQLIGYSPVTLLRDKKWIKGTSQFSVQFEKHTYHLCSADEVKIFNASPDLFVPQFRGYDPVVIWDKKQHVPGSTRFAAFYDDQLYLFETKENRDQFKQTPDRYLATRIVLDPDLIDTVIR